MSSAQGPLGPHQPLLVIIPEQSNFETKISQKEEKSVRNPFISYKQASRVSHNWLQKRPPLPVQICPMLTLIITY